MLRKFSRSGKHWNTLKRRRSWAALMQDRPTRRVVVTGLGLVTPLGTGVEKTWKALCAGESGIGRITRFDPTGYDAQIAGEVKDFDPAQFIEKKEIKKMDTFIHYAVGASPRGGRCETHSFARGGDSRRGLYRLRYRRPGLH